MRFGKAKTSRGTTWVKTDGVIFHCDVCGDSFVSKARALRVGSKRACSQKCKSAILAAIRRSTFITPPSSANQRLVANQITRYHIRHSGFICPKKCAKCGKTGKMDPHHFDYTKPLSVIFLCRGCHFSGHLLPKFLDGLMITEIPRANRLHRGQFKDGHKSDPMQIRNAALAAAASMTPEQKRSRGLRAASGRWGKSAKPQAFRLNRISEFCWEIVNNATGLVEEHIEKTSDDSNRPEALRRVAALNARARRGTTRKHYDDDAVDPILSDALEKLPSIGKLRRA